MKRILLILLMIGGIAYGQCPQVTGLSVSSLSTTGGKATYTAASGATLYVWGIYVPGGAFVTGGSTTSTTFNFTGLTASTTYRLKVRTTCGLSVSGDDSLTFSTLSASAMYTPLTAQGYQIKYLKVDSGFNLPLHDTTLLRGINQAGAQVYKPGAGVFVYNGSYWQGISGGTGTIIITDSSRGIDSITFNGYMECIYLHDSITPRCWQLNTFFDDVRLSDDSTLYEFYNGDSLVKTVPSGIKNVGAVWPLSYDGVDLTTSKPFNDSLYLSSLVKHSDSLFSVKLTGDSVFVGLMSGSGGSSSGIDSMYVTTDSLYQVFIYSSGRRDSVGYSGSSGTGTTLNGTGFVKATGTTITYDNSTYLTAEVDPKRLTTLGVTGTTTKTITATLADASTVTTTFTDATGGGSSSINIYDTVPVWNRVGKVLTGDNSVENNLIGEPSVIREGSPQILTSDSIVFKMWYGTGTNTVGYAESVDGATWSKYSSNPIVSNHIRSFVFKDGSTYYMYAANNAQTQIDRLTSSNGLSWTLTHTNVLGTNTWGTGYFNTSIIVDGGTWRMLVESVVGAVFNIGYYTSTDLGITWSQPATNPVMGGVGQDVGGPFVKKIGSTYYAWVHGGVSTVPLEMYRYSSPDMITWTKLSTPAFPRRQLDEGAQDPTGQASDACYVEVDSSVYMFYAATRNGISLAYGVYIKLAVANMSFYKLVQTHEGDGGGVITDPVFTRSTDGTNGYLKSGSIAIGDYVPAASSILDLTSTTKGLLPPRMTTTQMNAISSPATGLVIFNTTANTPYYYNGSAWVTLASWTILGNSSIDSTINFLGTIDNKPLILKLNNIKRGYISPSMGTIFLGDYPSSLTGAGIENTVVGWGSGIALTSGADNSFFGTQSGISNTTGGFNVAVGYKALWQNVSRSNNTAVGREALKGILGGDGNSAFGYLAGSAITGATNTAIGQGAIGAQASSGSSNTGVGFNSLAQNTSGGSNIAIGANAGFWNSTVSQQFFADYTDRNSYDGNKNTGLLYGVMNLSMLSQRFTVNGKFGINENTPTAFLQLTPGSNAANTAPLKFTQDSIVTTATSGNGTSATITFATQNFNIPVGATVRVTGVTPSGYNGTYTVLTSSQTSITYANATTGSQTVAGRVTTGMLLTTPEGGSMEYDGTDYYLTDKTATRYLLSRTLTGTAAPATTPTAIGIHFIDTTNKKEYVSTGTSSSADWTILN